jgi:nucleoside-diphosphate-sugar epimerase
MQTNAKIYIVGHRGLVGSALMRNLQGKGFIVAANQALADRNRFELDEAQWQAFQPALERPVQQKPRLKKLLAEPGILD